jgi:hypothetical protein
MIKNLILGALSFTCLNLASQVIPNIDWVKYKSDRSQISNVPSAIDANNNAFITGYMFVTPSNANANTVKYDPLGVELWTASYDNGGFDNSKAIVLDAAGNSYVTGESDGTGTGRDIITIKYDPNGNQLWAMRYNGAANGNDVGNSIVVDPSGNVFVTGYITNSSGNRDYVTLKYNASGVLQFAVNYAGAGNQNDEAVAIAFNSNRLYVTGTSINGSSNSDIVTLRINPNTGATLWSKSENGTANGNDIAYALLANGNDVVVVGQVNNTTTGNDYLTVRYNGNNGSTQWSKTYDFANTSGGATALTADASGNFAVTGIVINGSNYEYHTILYSNGGIQQWVNKVSTNLNYSSANPQIAVDPVANHFYVSGQKSGVGSDILVYQITPSGNKTWEETFNGAQNSTDAAVDLVVNSSGVLYVAGASLNSSAKYDYTTIKISQTPVYFPIDYNNANEPFANNHYFYPNQNHILDINGNVVNNIKYYTKNTYPQQFILDNNNLSFLLAKQDTSAQQTDNDSLFRVDLEFIKGNSLSRVYPFDIKNDGVLNYFLSHVSQNPITDVKGASRLMIPNIYPNIDLHYYSNTSGLKMYFVVKPGANPGDILMNFNGASSSNINGNGSLTINTTLGNFSFAKPQSYNVNFAMQTPTATGNVSWSNVTGNLYKINAGTYNAALPLIIQVNQGSAVAPNINNLNWSTYFGGISGDLIYSSKSDALNNLFVCGSTISNNFPPGVGLGLFPSIQGAGTYDGFLAKFNSVGELRWSTYLGGNKRDRIYSLDFNGGDVYCVGITTSSNMPIQAKAGAYNKSNFVGPLFTASGDKDNIFIFQIDSALGQTNKWLTYYGGNDFDFVSSCKFDASGNFFLVGGSVSSDIPVVASGGQYSQVFGAASYQQSNQLHDAIIAKFSAGSSALNWATYFGTSSSSVGKLPTDDFQDVAFDNSGNVYAVGKSGGNSLPSKINNEFTTSNPDGMVAKFTNNGQLLSSKYTQKNELNAAVRVFNNKVYMGGYSSVALVGVNSGLYYYNNTSNPGGSPGAYDGSLIITDLSLNTIHATLLPGNKNDKIKSIEFDANGLLYLTGGTESSNFPISTPANTYFSPFNTSNSYEYFVTAMLEGYTNLLWSTYLGSSGVESNFGNNASIAIDGNNNLHVSGVTTSSSGFPTDNGGGPPTYFQNSSGGGTWDATVTRFNLTPVQAVGIAERLNKENLFAVYPNPAKNFVIIDNPSIDAKVLNYSIYNSVGQLNLTGETKNLTDNKIDVSTLTTGAYILKFNTNTNSYNSKFIKVD